MTHRTLICALLLAISALCVNAATITASLPEFNGPLNTTGPFGMTLNVGTFVYTLPVGEQIISATLTGTFGNSKFPDAAGEDLRAGGLLFASCAPLASCDTGMIIEPFSFTFPSANFGLLSGGSLAVTATQLSGNIVRLGPETLTINTQPTEHSTAVAPEPTSLGLLGGGLVALGLIKRRTVRS
jgi:PEP-CTERM motif